MTNRMAEPPPGNLHRVLDEDGKDRTPKPLVQRSAAAGYTAGPGRADANPGNSTSGSTRQSRLSSRVSTMSLQLRGSVTFYCKRLAQCGRFNTLEISSAMTYQKQHCSRSAKKGIQYLDMQLHRLSDLCKNHMTARHVEWKLLTRPARSALGT
ncbi:hypothetical protein WJX75_000434 [Coccomyxa subellipsoidea]|uniref:Uncharacterized protein n=1 Tax=Coccomyxa subellipsoidea TaxID=248742 RepID=A0ABR2YSZ8_9CHLO